MSVSFGRPSRGRPAWSLVLVALVLLAPSAPAMAAPSSYSWPVPGTPVRAFDAPSGPYGAGHRGVDLPVDAGDPVLPMAPGTVTFAGPVVGDVWVTVQHADGIRTSYGPLRPGTHVRTGQALDGRTALGHARGDAHGHRRRLHVGARVGDTYVDPALLVRRRLVATLVGPGHARVVTGDAPARPTLVRGAAPSPNHLVVLPGLTSRTGHQPFDLDALGYGHDGTWQQYSYAGLDAVGAPLRYGPQDTWGRVHGMAIALRDQLRAHAADHPAEAVDLMGHSLGGLVAVYYLLVLHDPTDPSLPPIGRVATVASPLQGADAADAIARVRDSALGRSLLGLLADHLPTDAAGQPTVHPDVAVLDDLHTDSAVVRAVKAAWARHRRDPYASPLATGTDVLTIGSTLDPVVTEHRSGLPGAAHEAVLDLDPLDAHVGATTDARSTQLLAAFLAGEPLPARGLPEHLVNATAPLGSRLLAAVEQLAGIGVRAASRAVALP